MRTAGIDLASQPKDTVVCVIDWTDAEVPATVSRYSAGWTDDDLMGVMGDTEVDRIGIDAPFGWPIEFVTAVSAYRDHGIWPVADSDCLRFRATERRLGSGLSPSLDQLVWVVLRCARLLDRCARENATGIDRTGEGRFVEVYPAAALERWEVSPAKSSEDPGSYKGEKPASAARRQRLMGELVAALNSVVALPHDFVEECVGTGGDHLVDAFVAALVARTMGLGNCDPIPTGATQRAESEGWIRLPRDSTVHESVTNPVPAWAFQDSCQKRPGSATPRSMDLPRLYLNFIPELDWLIALEFGRVDDAQPPDNWRGVSESFGYLCDEPGGREVGFKILGYSEFDPETSDVAEIWDEPNFYVPVLGLTQGSAGEITLAARALFGSEGTVNRQFFNAATQAEGEEALRFWIACLQAGDSMAHFGLGYTLHELGRYPEAYRHLRHYTEIAPCGSWNWRWHGVAARDSNEIAEARSAFERAIELEEKGDLETDARELLESINEPGAS